MIFLIASIVCSTAIYAIFKLFSRFEIHTFQAIVANYFVASGFGFWYASGNGNGAFTLDQPWIGLAALVGVIFISLFYIMALTSQTHGVSVTSIASKMSMVIPALFFIITDPDETADVLKITGIVLGVVAVVLASTKKSTGVKLAKAVWIPIVLFIGSGLLDLLLAYTEKLHLGSDEAYQDFVPVPFGVAAIIGTVVLSGRILAGKDQLHLRSLGAGVLLGLVNYGSIYFLLSVLGGGYFDRSSAIPANNMGVVALSALVGFLIFRERLTPKNILGIVLSLVAIAFLTWAN
jgi:drug/metabolite transporter (DMT)-like permease